MINLINADLVEKKGLGVYGRNVTIPKAKGRACQFTFSDLCEQVRFRSTPLYRTDE